MKIKVGLGHAIDPKVGVVEHPPCCYSHLVQFLCIYLDAANELQGKNTCTYQFRIRIS